MASVREFVEKTVGRFNIRVDAVELDVLLTDAGITDNGQTVDYDTVTGPKAKAAVLNLLSSLLAMPDIQEGDMSIKYDRVAVATYVASLRTDLGLTDTSAPTVTDKSYLW